MAKRELKQLSWKVKNYVFQNKITDYDVLKYREDQIKKFKKQSTTKEEFAERLRREFMYSYCSKAEHELIISIDDNNRIWLEPWVGCKNPEEVKIDVTDDTLFDWRSFAKHHILDKGYKDNSVKIDVWDQLEWCFDELVDYLWFTRLRYERKHEKFSRPEEENV